MTITLQEKEANMTREDILAQFADERRRCIVYTRVM